MIDQRARLEHLLAEDVDAAEQREIAVVAAIAAHPGGVVLVGAGGLGKRCATALRVHGIEPRGFVDARASDLGGQLLGLPVLTADAAARAWRTATFVVTIWGAGNPHRFDHTHRRLTSLGITNVLPPAPLMWGLPSALPFYCLDRPSTLLTRTADVLAGYDVLDDERSRAEYVSQIEFRLWGDARVLSTASPGRQYFPTDVITAHPHEVFVDCGAYDGDTLRDLVGWSPYGFARYVALEPDPATAALLRQSVARLPEPLDSRVAVVEMAASDVDGTVTFTADGTPGAKVTIGDGITVRCGRLDDLVAAQEVTFLKMDIEGAELAAIDGARRLLTTHQPLAAVAVYHVQDHLWEVPQRLRALLPHHHIVLRAHHEEAWDTVCYAVPRSRRAGQASEA